jgi:hypothetical protein
LKYGFRTSGRQKYSCRRVSLSSSIASIR